MKLPFAVCALFKNLHRVRSRKPTNMAAALLGPFPTRVLCEIPEGTVYIRAAEASHVPALVAIQDAIYPPSLLESAPVFLSRFEIYPHGHVVAALQRAGAPAATHDEIVGYASMYPWPEVLPGDEKGELERTPSAPEGVPPSFYHPPHLNADETCTHILAALESGSRAMFFHEVSVALQKRGIGPKLLDALLEHARSMGYRHAGLVAVLGNESRWGAHGFVRIASFIGGYGGANAHSDTPVDDAKALPDVVMYRKLE
jgi:ribosomal protein S18 acetylase RimI-like enzyme